MNVFNLSYRFDFTKRSVFVKNIGLTIVLSISFIQQSYSQENKFIPIDSETLEFIKSVDYQLYSLEKLVYSGQTSSDSITRLPKVRFDSIIFKKEDYKDYGIRIDELNETVPMTKKVFALDEVVVIANREDDLIIGEKSRFIKRQSRNILTNTDFGILFNLEKVKNKKLCELIFYVDKIKHKTNYKVKFYSVEELGNPLSYQYLDLINTIYETSTQTLEVGTKNKVALDLCQENIHFEFDKIFVTVELIEYLNEDNDTITPSDEKKTKLKFQTSKELNYYSKTSDYHTKETSTKLININLMINYDFATDLFMTPHKSILISPAILLKFKANN